VQSKGRLPVLKKRDVSTRKKLRVDVLTRIAHNKNSCNKYITTPLMLFSTMTFSTMTAPVLGMAYLLLCAWLSAWLVVSAIYVPLREYAGPNFFDAWDYFNLFDNTTWGR